MKIKRLTTNEIVISLILIFAICFVLISSIQLSSTGRQNLDYGTFLDEITEATDQYLNENLDAVSPLYLDYGYIKVMVANLIEAGLVDADLINPRTGQKLGKTSTDYIIVSLASTGKLSFEFNPSEVTESYLESQTLVLVPGQAFDCSDLASYEGEWQSPALRLVNKDGKVDQNLGLENIITKVECDINLMVPKTYTITYTYLLPDTKAEKVYRREVTVLPSMDDIVKLSATLEVDKIKMDEELSFTVMATDRRGEIKTLNQDEYAIKLPKVTKAGTYRVTIMANDVNSDGTIAKTTIFYEVEK